MQAVKRLLMPAALLWQLALPAAAGAAAPGVEVENRDGRFVVRSAATVAADAAVAWQVISDYNRLAEFVPDLRFSRIISAPGEPLQVEQGGEAGFFIFRFPLHVVLEITEFAPRRLTFRAIRGNLRSMRGEWRIRAAASGVVLDYFAELEPAFWVPSLVGPAVIRRDVAAQIGAVVREIERRQAVHAAPSASSQDK